MQLSIRGIGGGKIPGLNGLYVTGRHRIPTACWCHYVLRSTCAVVGRDLAALRNISNTIIYTRTTIFRWRFGQTLLSNATQ